MADYLIAPSMIQSLIKMNPIYPTRRSGRLLLEVPRIRPRNVDYASRREKCHGWGECSHEATR